MKPKAETLFHFTKSFDVLKSILKNGFYPHFCLEDIRWIQFGDETRAHPMVCFCDIPLSRINEHTDFYGNFGLGLTRAWAEQSEIYPVSYVPENSPLYKMAEFLLSTTLSDVDVDLMNASSEHYFKLMAYARPMSGIMEVNGARIEKNFYQENEWRFVPEDLFSLYEDEYDDVTTRAGKNKIAEDFSLKFNPSDIKYIFVESKIFIPELVEYIYKLFYQYSFEDINVLVTRIIALEDIRADL